MTGLTYCGGRRMGLRLVAFAMATGRYAIGLHHLGMIKRFNDRRPPCIHVAASTVVRSQWMSRAFISTGVTTSRTTIGSCGQVMIERFDNLSPAACYMAGLTGIHSHRRMGRRFLGHAVATGRDAIGLHHLGVIKR